MPIDWRHMFALPSARATARTPEEQTAFDAEFAKDEALLEKVATAVASRRMTVPAILFLESVKPLNYIGAQAMTFMEPMVLAVLDVPDFKRLRDLLESRDSLERLIVKIEGADARIEAERHPAKPRPSTPEAQ